MKPLWTDRLQHQQTGRRANVLGDYSVLANDRNPSAKIEDSRGVIAIVSPFDLGVFSLSFGLLLVYLVVGYVVDCLHAWLCRWCYLVFWLRDFRSGDLRRSLPFGPTSGGRGLEDLVAVWPGLQQSGWSGCAVGG